MQQIETIQEFYKTLSEKVDIRTDSDGIGHFNVFPRKYCSPTASFHRRDFYKISLIAGGTGVIHFAHRSSGAILLQSASSPFMGANFQQSGRMVLPVYRRVYTVLGSFFFGKRLSHVPHRRKSPDFSRRRSC